jgi:hypothetical protein
MKTSTQVYRELKAALFSDPQARALVEILRAAGTIEPEPPESELERIEQYLLAEPFEPFVIEMTGGKSYRIERRDQCGFSRHGSVQLYGVDEMRRSILSSDHIVRVQKL